MRYFIIVNKQLGSIQHPILQNHSKRMSTPDRYVRSIFNFYTNHQFNNCQTSNWYQSRE